MADLLLSLAYLTCSPSHQLKHYTLYFQDRLVVPFCFNPDIDLITFSVDSLERFVFRREFHTEEPSNDLLPTIKRLAVIGPDILDRMIHYRTKNKRRVINWNYMIFNPFYEFRGLKTLFLDRYVWCTLGLDRIGYWMCFYDEQMEFAKHRCWIRGPNHDPSRVSGRCKHKLGLWEPDVSYLNQAEICDLNFNCPTKNCQFHGERQHSSKGLGYVRVFSKHNPLLHEFR